MWGAAGKPGYVPSTAPPRATKIGGLIFLTIDSAK
jgi:hypothetical protein